MLQSARGPVLSLAEAIAGAPIQGSWWGHPRGREIFLATRVLMDSPEVLVSRLVDGKVTYVHRRLWPALVKLASRFPRARLAQIREVLTKSGAHKLERTPFPRWVPADVARRARLLSEAAAEKALARVLPKRSRSSPSRAGRP